jgi:hypothetical protein
LQKVGDDLRQDILTLQIMRIMDGLWKDEGHDLFLIPYRVAATGTNAGMIEVVAKSKTTAEIHKVILITFFPYNFSSFFIFLYLVYFYLYHSSNL